MGVVTGALVAGWLGVATSSAVTDIAAKPADTAQFSLASDTSRADARQQFLASLGQGKPDLRSLAAQLPRATGSLSEARDLLTPREARGIGLPRLATTVATPAGKTDAASKLRATAAMIRKLGLDPARFLAAAGSATPVAAGGPYVPVSARTLTQSDQGFDDPAAAWQKLSEMEAGIASIPSYLPVRNADFSSNFGVRSDPFNGHAAMHQGLDMPGSRGEPIYAAASGVVERAGRANGYGNLVELEHGKGLATRYGHLSAILVRAGETVKQGQLIGRMGSTGRSTGTHLHYEIRVDGRAVNPRPFLEASSYVLAAQAEAPQAAGPQPLTAQVDELATRISYPGLVGQR